MIEGHNQSNMPPEQAELADLPEWSDDDFNRYFPNG
jgi:hypothetical protein